MQYFSRRKYVNWMGPTAV